MDDKKIIIRDLSPLKDEWPDVYKALRILVILSERKLKGEVRSGSSPSVHNPHPR